MIVHLGTLEFLPAVEHPELIAQPVFEFISSLSEEDKNTIGVVEINPEFSDTTAFCQQYQLGLHEAANCIVLAATRGNHQWFAACVVLGNTRADVNGVARRTLDARRVSFASMEQAVAQTNMEYGGIAPVGLPQDWSILIDRAIAQSQYVIIGSGLRKSKLAVPSEVLARLPNAQVIENLGKVQ